MKNIIWIGLMLAIAVASCKSKEKTVKENTEAMVPENASANLIINDIWALQSIKGIDYTAKNIEKGAQIPVLEFHIKEMRYGGNDACNSIFGAIDKINSSEIVFGTGGSTRMFCEDDEVSPIFKNNMTLVSNYKIEKTTLMLLDAKGAVLMTFRKID